MDKNQLRLISGGILGKGDRVTINDRLAVIVHAAFETHVFRGEVSVRFDDGTLELVPVELVKKNRPTHEVRGYFGGLEHGSSVGYVGSQKTSQKKTERQVT